MPELPEVETVRRGLEPYLAGQVIEEARVVDARLTQPVDPVDVAAALRGRRVERVARRGKYLLLELEGGETALHHLRMTGSFSVGTGIDDARHLRAWYRIGGRYVRYHDPRRFGTLLVLRAAEAQEYLDARLGPEPLREEFTPAALARALARRRAPVKAVLLDQQVVAGLGNIYVDESLFQARISPLRPADEVSRRAVGRLHAAIVDRLEVAVRVGGSTLRDYRGVEGEAGAMQERFLVYGKGGTPCVSCGQVLRTGRVAGRGTTWCPRCQRR